MNQLGFETNPRGYYIIGFATYDPTSTELIKAKGIPCSEKAFSVPDKLLSPNLDLLIHALSKQKHHFSKDSYTAYAIADFTYLDDERQLDIWTIDENKQLFHLQDGYESQNLPSFWKKISYSINKFFNN